MSDIESTAESAGEGTASARLPRADEQPPLEERPEGAEALPAAQEQPPSFMYGSAAAGTAREPAEPVEPAEPAGNPPTDGQPGE